MIKWFSPEFEVCKRFYAQFPSRIFNFQANRTKDGEDPSCQSQNIRHTLCPFARRFYVSLSLTSLQSTTRHCIVFMNSLVHAVNKYNSTDPCKHAAARSRMAELAQSENDFTSLNDGWLHRMNENPRDWLCSKSGTVPICTQSVRTANYYFTSLGTALHLASSQVRLNQPVPSPKGWGRVPSQSNMLVSAYYPCY
jgi:hypothetical protein